MSIIVTLPRDPIWEPLEWAKKHCPSYITNTARTRFIDNDENEIYYDIDYHFGNEKDAIKFALRWI